MRGRCIAVGVVLANLGACTLLSSRDGLTGGGAGSVPGTGGNGANGGTAPGGTGGTAGIAPCVAPGEEPLPAPPSCLELTQPCGDGCSCCDAVLIPGGTLPMGTGDAGSGADSPEHDVRVDPFRLDRFEVSVVRFRRFVEAMRAGGSVELSTVGHHPSLAVGWNPDWDPMLDGGFLTGVVDNATTWTEAPDAAHEGYAINVVTWYMAYAFCVWDGGWLPSEAEWEFAAAGGGANLTYPWGNEDPTEYRAVYGLTCPDAEPAGACHPSDFGPLGSKPNGVGRFGNLDLAGGMTEWTLDAFDPAWYGSRVNDSFAHNVNLADAGFHTLRGGSWESQAARLRASARWGDVSADVGYGDLGFRCARPAD